MLREKKTILTLTWLTVVTTVLFGLLAGTPFLTFNPTEIKRFYYAMIFISVITFLFWLINILLILLSEKLLFLKKILLRGILSSMIGLLLSTSLFYYFQKIAPPPRAFAANGIGNQGLQMQPPLPRDLQNIDISNDGMAPQEIKPNTFSLQRKPRFIFFPLVIHSLTINLIILILCELVFLYYKKEKIENENLKLRQTNIEAKNNQLKMQLQPHFLFNSLNTLRLLLHQNKADAEIYLHKLSTILRHSTRSAFETVTAVAEELALCITYLEMQQMRFGNMLQFTVSNEAIYNSNGKLPVYSLQLLAENAIKHNSLTNENPLEIFIDYQEASGEITIRNKLNPKRIKETTSKIGLANLSERYWLLNHEKIRVTETSNEFSVSIKVL